MTRILYDFRGQPVRLTRERLEHVLEHPEMEGLEPRLKETLEAPQMIIQSRTDPEAQLFYRLS